MEQTALTEESLVVVDDAPCEPQELAPRDDVIRILLVDDSVTIRRTAESLLKREGYDVEAAEDGPKAPVVGITGTGGAGDAGDLTIEAGSLLVSGVAQDFSETSPRRHQPPEARSCMVSKYTLLAKAREKALVSPFEPLTLSEKIL